MRCSSLYLFSYHEQSSLDLLAYMDLDIRVWTMFETHIFMLIDSTMVKMATGPRQGIKCRYNTQDLTS